MQLSHYVAYGVWHEILIMTINVMKFLIQGMYSNDTVYGISYYFDEQLAKQTNLFRLDA